jgi:hypothetical protein
MPIKTVSKAALSFRPKGEIFIELQKVFHRFEEDLSL